jgi:hypothetical protein
LLIDFAHTRGKARHRLQTASCRQKTPITATDRPFDFLNLLTWVDFSRVAKVSDAPDELARLLAAVRATPSPGDTVREAICPYRGLDAFREEDAAFFFGRGSASEPESPIGQLVQRIRDHPRDAGGPIR